MYQLISTTFWVSFFIILTIFAVMKSNKNVKNKYSNYISWSIGIIGFSWFLLIMIGILVLINQSYKNDSGEFAPTADGFTIEEYKIVMDVKKNNSVDLTEYVTVNFYEDGHHGIYRSIPYWLEYTNKEHVTQSRKANIKNIEVIGDQYDLETVNGRRRIQIGDPDNILPTGNHKYEIHYTYDLGSDPYDNYDEFIFHAFGDYWGTEIKNASLTIRMPKEFDTNKITFFSDKYRQSDITPFVNYTVDDSVIEANISQDYQLMKSLTIDIELPDHYFTGGHNLYGYTSFVFCIICIGIAILSIILWGRHGKDLSVNLTSPEYGPPNNLDAADIGYLYKKDTGKKLTIATILELAKKGFIKITESEDKKTITVSKVNSTDVDKYIKREIKVVKLKQYKPPIIDSHITASLFMKNNFPKDVQEITITSDFDGFYANTEYLIENGFIKVESDTRNQYTEHQLNKIKEQLKADEFKGKPEMSSNEKIVYDRLFGDSDETDLATNTTFYLAFGEISENVRKRYDDTIHDVTAAKYMLYSSLGLLISTFAFGYAFCFAEDLNPKYRIIYLVALVSILVTLLFTILMQRRSKYGEEIKSRIESFKKYIEDAQKDQIDMYADQNPDYFYDILPYAYVLGVSKKWAKKFEKIPVPSSDMGNFDFYNTSSLDRLSSSVYTPSSSNNSSGCGGGGCSSCGGGCSSCGGGGSW